MDNIHQLYPAVARHHLNTSVALDMIRVHFVVEHSLLRKIRFASFEMTVQIVLVVVRRSNFDLKMMEMIEKTTILFHLNLLNHLIFFLYIFKNGIYVILVDFL